MKKKNKKNKKPTIIKTGYYGFGMKKDDDRYSKWKKQRTTMGFDDTETWSLYTTIIRFTLPRLKYFRKHHAINVTPNAYSVDDRSDMTDHDKWIHDLDILIAGLELWDDDGSCELSSDDRNKILELFIRMLPYLWW